jgi:hypothetical protein
MRMLKALNIRESYYLLLAVFLLIEGSAYAQLNGDHLKGDMGLDSGSQAPVGFYYGVMYYLYDTSRINNQNGTQFNANGSLNIDAGFGMFIGTTKWKLLGANYGFQVIPFAGVNAALGFPRFGLNPSPGFGDTYVQPLSLGWHFGRADVTAGFAIYVPTGRFSPNSVNNTGYGQWAYEPSIGTTVYLTKSKTYSASALASFEFNATKSGTTQHVGSLATLEGGIGRSFFQGGLKFGPVYYAQWKLSNDTIGTLADLLVRGKNSAAAVGPELTLPLATKKTLYALVTLRYEWEVYARTTTQGNTAIVQVVFPLKPLKISN